MSAWSRKTWKFCEEFFHFLEKRSLSNCRYCTDRRKICQGQPPTFGSHCSSASEVTTIWRYTNVYIIIIILLFIIIIISSKSIHFRCSYCRTRDDRFCPVQYLQLKLQITCAFSLMCKHIVAESCYIFRSVGVRRVQKASLTSKVIQGHWYQCHSIDHIMISY